MDSVPTFLVRQGSVSEGKVRGYPIPGKLLVVRRSRDVVERVPSQSCRLGSVLPVPIPVGDGLKGEVGNDNPTDDAKLTRPSLEGRDDVQRHRLVEVELVPTDNGRWILCQQESFNLRCDIEGFKVKGQSRSVTNGRNVEEVTYLSHDLFIT